MLRSGTAREQLVCSWKNTKLSRTLHGILSRIAISQKSDFPYADVCFRLGSDIVGEGVPPP